MKPKEDLANTIELKKKVVAVNNSSPELLEGVADIDLLDVNNLQLVVRGV